MGFLILILSQTGELADILSSSVWLLDVAKTLCRHDALYVGFDISSLQFPTPASLPPEGSFMFKVHDMTRHFPAEYHAQFDLVNIRLVVQALKAANVALVISNALQLLSESLSIRAIQVLFH